MLVSTNCLSELQFFAIAGFFTFLNELMNSHLWRDTIKMSKIKIKKIFKKATSYGFVENLMLANLNCAQKELLHLDKMIAIFVPIARKLKLLH